MSGKTRHFRHAVEKIHHLEIEEVGTSLLIKEENSEIRIQEYPDFKIYASSGVMCIESKLSLKEIPSNEILEERFIPQEELVEIEEDVLKIEGITCSNWRYSADEEDLRFGDSSVNAFSSLLFNLFGGRIKQQLAFDPAMD